ncbi:hypothetical protein MHB54_28020 [Paenibacillus sp. FSL M7-0802]
MKHIRVVKKDGTVIIHSLGTDLDVLELTTAFQTDRVDYQGKYTYIHLKG